jgi:hypothetical protein
MRRGRTGIWAIVTAALVLGAVGCAQLAAEEPHSIPGCMAAHIDSTTRNHSTGTETVLIAENGTARLPIRIAENAATETKGRANQHPAADMVGVGPDDGGGWCLCPECAKWGDRGNRLLLHGEERFDWRLPAGEVAGPILGLLTAIHGRSRRRR